MKQIVKLTYLSLGVVLGFLLLPLPSAFFQIDKRFEADPSIELLTTSENHGARCKSDTVYSTKANEEIHAKEGYGFTVDDYCANIQKELIDAIVSRDVDRVRGLIGAGANPQTKDYSNFEGIGPIQVASSRDVAVAKVLLDNGADPNEETCCCASCHTPLVNAIWENNSEMVELLLQRGANVRYKSKWPDLSLEITDAAYLGRDPKIFALLENACGFDVVCRAEFRVKRLADWCGYKPRN